MTLATQIIGILAAIAGSSIMLPQVVRTLRTKHVEDLSSAMLALFFANAALWLAYGILIHDAPVTLTNAISLVIVSLQIGLKIRYRA